MRIFTAIEYTLMLLADNLQKEFGALKVLKGVSLKIDRGEFVAITGPSGAGKSTLLHILGGLEKPDAGSVRFEGVNLFKMNATRQYHFRNRNMGFIFQFHHLLPEFTALENICMPLWIAGASTSAAKAKGKALLGSLGLGERAQHKPEALSGGEQQRVAIARAIINEPAVVFADEPTGNLDTANARSVHELFMQLRDRYRLTFVVVTHNDELAEMADRKLMMRDGRLLPGE